MPSFAKIDAAKSLIENDPSKILGLHYGSEDVRPADIVPKERAQSPPGLSHEAATGRYLVICLDLDAPFRSFNLMSPIVHWLQSDLETDGTTTSLKSNSTPAMPWAPPRPPPGAAFHRYIFCLYRQPGTFDAKKYEGVGMWARTRFNLDAFEREHGLGPILAANYFISR